MGIKFRAQQNNSDSEGNIFWVTMADLLLGLAIIFITLFVLAMTGFSQQSVQQQKVQMEVSEKISGELEKENIQVDIDKMTGDLKISDVELFELSSWELSDNGKKLLDKVAPIYINSIFADKELDMASMKDFRLLHYLSPESGLMVQIPRVHGSMAA